MHAPRTRLSHRKAHDCQTLVAPSTHTRILDNRSVLIQHRAFKSQAPHRAPRPLVPPARLGAAESKAQGRQAPVDAGATLDVHKVLRVHYRRRDKRYENWGLHVWGDAKEQTDWQRPIYPVGMGPEGVWFEVPLRPGARFLGMLVHAGESKSARAELKISDLGDSNEVWLAGDEQQPFLGRPPSLSNLPVGTLSKQSAIWISEDTIAWRHEIMDANGPRRFHLHCHSKAHLWVNASGVQGSEHVWELKAVASKLATDLEEKYPYLAGCACLKIPSAALDMLWSLFRGQLAVSVSDTDGMVMDVTGVQLQGALDAHCAYDGDLGVFRDADTKKLTIAVWAPTAQSVHLLLYRDARGGQEEVLSMTHGTLGSGVWSVQLPDGVMGSYYKYRVTVYHPESQRIEVSEATDPYSRSLAADGDRTQIVLPELDDNAMVPKGWHTHAIPSIERWTDISVYELHIRDFSSEDETVKPELRGRYLAFVPEEAPLSPGGTTSGLSHLAALKQAGLNHLHLLPTYDFGSVPERPEDQKHVQGDLRCYAPDGEEQQAAVLAVADQDAFNWGYDPVHYGVPEGSYATNPDGVCRIREFRQMVMALHQQGWRVVLDVVYNHVFSAGPQNRYSVLDKIVPRYYQRRFEDGEVCQSTCCNNTATENYMCERLVVDDIVHWAKDYKIDGFRFDIMGHLLLRTLEKMRKRLDALTVAADGVDGARIYIYGEAWDFGEVVNNARGRNCGQMNLAGTGLGAFNDRLRDGALGGGPFAPHDFQGLVTGLALAPSSCRGQGGLDDQMQELLALTDWVRYSMAGNLRRYELETSTGERLSGEQARAHDQPLAYGGLPCEHVAFIGCHDNLTMFDAITEKAPLTAVGEDRMRMQVLCLSLIIFSQGIPFVHAGDDILRSKSLDRDSYNSGDWFNGIDWTGRVHKLGIGLPVATKNHQGWFYKRPLLANPLIKPSSTVIQTAARITQQLIRIRYSSPLFRIGSTEAVCQQVRFHNTGPQQQPGIIVMELVSAPSPQSPPASRVDGTDVSHVYDAHYSRIVLIINAGPLAQTVPYPTDAGPFLLHPEQRSSTAPDPLARQSHADDVKRVFFVPKRTTAVFVQPR